MEGKRDDGKETMGHFYCLVCRINLRDGPGARKRHRDGDPHSKSLATFVESFAAVVRDKYREMREIQCRDELTVCGSAQLEEEWLCPLCDIYVDSGRSAYVGHAAYQHLAGKKHSRMVDTFVSTYVPTSLRHRYKKKHLRFTQGSFLKYKEREEAYVRRGPPTRAFLARNAFPNCAPMPEANVPGSLAEEWAHAKKSLPGAASAAIGAALPPGYGQEARVEVSAKEEPSSSGEPSQAEELCHGVREEIKALVAAANDISRKKKGLKDLRHKRTSDGLIPSSRYLPNFGGVWVSGPRSQTMSQFKMRKVR